MGAKSRRLLHLKISSCSERNFLAGLRGGVPVYVLEALAVIPSIAAVYGCAPLIAVVVMTVRGWNVGTTAVEVVAVGKMMKFRGAVSTGWLFSILGRHVGVVSEAWGSECGLRAQDGEVGG